MREDEVRRDIAVGKEAVMSTFEGKVGGLDRFDAALYTVPEAARYLDVPASTQSTWTHGYR